MGNLNENSSLGNDTLPVVQIGIQRDLFPPTQLTGPVTTISTIVNPPTITTDTTTTVTSVIETTSTPLSDGMHLKKSHSSPALPTLRSAQAAATTTTTTITARTKKRLHFRARPSALDAANLESSKETFRGFFTLFWIAMAFYVILTMIRNVEQEGTLLSLSLFSLFSKDAVTLMISDFTMVTLTVGAVVYAKLLVWGWLQYYSVGMALQHSLQAAFLGMNIYWTFFRDWPWVQSGFFVLHTIVMMMKMHSYTSLCGDLSAKYHRLTALKQQLPRWIAEHNTRLDPDGSTEYTDAERDELARMEDEMKELEEDLVHGSHRFPDNVTFVNYFDYLLVPSLVYQLEYPRTDRIRPWYVFEKSVATLGTFLLLYMTTERYILPTVFDPEMPSWRVIVELLFPFMINYLLIFYIIFECICNGFAEVSR
ncbi:hypothetical protein BC938DRAFT_471890 [Jimgerdemannia flammicorona]|uniref:O-acyltransferase n=1 Tax=Jimgerdemannia flammicorona TaxID=994334 RepID=A0A433QUC9_9FUNG|nr:hypothetical protein BC938DRAFT_471890 [Jimgerdemannia flammicorona]